MANPETSSAQPLDRIGLLLAMLGLLVAAACISTLRNNLLFPTGFWNTDTELYDLRFDAQLAALVTGIALLQFVPARLAHAVIAAEAMAVLAPYGVRGAFWVGGLIVWFCALEVPLPKALRPLVPLVLFVAAAALGSTHLAVPAFLFSIFFSCRLMLYAWDKWQRGWPRGDLREYLFHFAAPPLLVLAPYLVIVPFYGTYSKHFAPRLTPARAREGFAQIGAGLLSATVLVLLRVYVHAQAPAFVLLRHYLAMVLGVGALAQVAHGLLLLHGLIDRPPIDRPLLATNYVEVWTRFESHQKDMQMAMFFTPVLLRLRRANRYVAITAATAAAVLFGNLAIHVLARYAFAPAASIAQLGTLYEFYVPTFLVLSASLCFQEWKRRTKRKAPRGIKGAVYVAVTWALTTALTAVLMRD